MRSPDLVHAACAALEAPSASPAVKKAAVEALLTAVTEGLVVPTSAARLIWSFWTSAPGNRSWRYSSKLGEIADEHIRAAAIAILDREDAGDELRDVALDVLVGNAHAAHVDDRVLLRAFERAHTGQRAQEIARLIGSVHAARGIGPVFLRVVRDRWAVSETSAVREMAITIASEIPEPEMPFIEKMLADPDVEVRTTMAHRLDMEFPGHELALGLVEARLRVEVHPRAHAALLRTQASLVESAAAPEPRRRAR